MRSGPEREVYPTNWKRRQTARQGGRGSAVGRSGTMLRVTDSPQLCQQFKKVAAIGDRDAGLSVGGRVEKEEIPEVRLQANKDSKADTWELAICEAREESVRVFTDGSMNEKGKVGGRWHIDGLGEGKEGLGKLAIVWDRKVVGMRGGL